MRLFDMIKKKLESFNKHFSNDMIIDLDRESVCMGDDCTSHNTSRNFKQTMLISDFLQELSNYVPSMTNVVWAVISPSSINRVIGYITTNEEGKPTIEVNGSNEYLKDIFQKEVGIEVFCRYYHHGRFSWIDGKTKQHIEKYSECKTLLEKVKMDCSEKIELVCHILI